MAEDPSIKVFFPNYSLYDFSLLHCLNRVKLHTVSVYLLGWFARYLPQSSGLQNTHYRIR